MPSPTHALRRLSRRLQGRFRTARPGSVLILVVALLVLMALIGTAWLSSARVDRYAVFQSSANTQIDLLVDGVVNMVNAALVGDITAGGRARPMAAGGAGYAHNDAAQADPVMGLRVPLLMQQAAPFHVIADAAYSAVPIRNRYYERGQFVRDGASYYVCTQSHVAGTAAPYVTGTPATETAYWELVGTGGAPDNYNLRPVYPVLSQLAEFAFTDISGRAPSATPMVGRVGDFRTRTFLMPDTIDFAGSTEFPAFRFFHTGTGQMEKVPAADTDGDGIADALLFRLPTGTLNGIDYYAAVRVIDNGSAINPTVAYRPTFRDMGATDEFDADTTPPELRLAGNFFPTNVDLRNLIEFGGETPANADSQVLALADYRFGGVPADPFASPVPTAFRFLSRFDNLWMQNGRRLGNPAAGRVLPTSEGTSLAYRGGTLINPSASLTVLEQPGAFASTIYNTVYNGPMGAYPGRTKYTGPTAIEDWFNNNFDYTPASAWKPAGGLIAGGASPVRALMAVRNGVTKLMPVRAADAAGTTPPLSAAAVTAVTTASPGLATAGLRSMANYGASPTQAAVNTAGWDTSVTPAVYNAGLAFSELWRAYAAAMTEQWGNYDTRTPFSDAVAYYGANPAMWGSPAPAAGWLLDPYVGSKFTPGPPVGTPPRYPFPPASSASVPPDFENPARMFRSSLRAVKPTAGAWPVTTPRLDPDQMALLRSSLAAVNAIDQRDLDDNVTAMKFPLSVRVTAPSSTQPPANVIARVYGHERQPYLTEIFVHTDALPRGTEAPPSTPPQELAILGLRNPAGYIAIEFYNPYNFPIDIQGCKLAALNRTAAGTYPNVELIDLSDANQNGNSAREDGDIVLADAISNLTTDIYGGPTIIPPFGYLVMENLLSPLNAGDTPNPDPRMSAALYRPPSSGLINTATDNKFDPTPANPARPVGVNYAYVPNLDLIYNREVVLVRPVSAEFNSSRASDADWDGAVDAVNPRILVYGNVQPSNTTSDTAQPIVPAAAVEFLVQRMVPLDSYDFTGLQHPDPTLGGSGPPPGSFFAHGWHYARGAPPAASIVDHLWQFVYPGRYDANQSDTVTRGPGNTMPRHQGTKQVRGAGGIGWQPGSTTPEVDPWEVPATTPTPIPTLEGGRRAVTPATIRDATYPQSFTIQMNNLGWAGPFPPAGTPRPAFPFAGIAREGDLLQIPFIGAYRVMTLAAEEADIASPGTVAARTMLELNAVPIDSSFAEDTDTADDPDNATAPVVTTPATFRAEQIGRFAPLLNDLTVFFRGSLDETGDTATALTIEDEELLAPAADLLGTYVVITSGRGAGQVRRVINYTAGAPGTPPTAGIIDVAQPFDPIPDETTKYEIRRGHYFWADDLLDYVTTSGPHADFQPDTMNSPTPTPVSNDGGTANNGQENTTPVHGLVNINTAPLPVLASVPFFSPRDPGSAGDDAYTFAATGAVTAASNGVDDNLEMAQAIINYRDREFASGRVPFRTLMDLYRVRQFQVINDMILIGALDPGDADDPGTAAPTVEPEGDITPPDTSGARVQDGVRRDFEEQFLLLTRVSNLITTRSDSFTNYILVQGWRGIGTPNPELVVQRRRAFVTDRSGVTQTNRDVPVQYFFND